VTDPIGSNVVVIPDDLLEVHNWAVMGKRLSLQEWVEACIRWTCSTAPLREAARRLARTNNRSLGNPTLNGLMLHLRSGDYMGSNMFCWHCGVRGIYMKVRPPDLHKGEYLCKACGKLYLIEELGVDGRRMET
jgi:hypothetical protein